LPFNGDIEDESVFIVMFLEKQVKNEFVYYLALYIWKRKSIIIYDAAIGESYSSAIVLSNGTEQHTFFNVLSPRVRNTVLAQVSETSLYYLSIILSK
jgi:hypothetical protein